MEHDCQNCNRDVSVAFACPSLLTLYWHRAWESKYEYRYDDHQHASYTCNPSRGEPHRSNHNTHLLADSCSNPDAHSRNTAGSADRWSNITTGRCANAPALRANAGANAPAHANAGANAPAHANAGANAPAHANAGANAGAHSHFHSDRWSPLNNATAQGLCSFTRLSG